MNLAPIIERTNERNNIALFQKGFIFMPPCILEIGGGFLRTAEEIKHGT